MNFCLILPLANIFHPKQTQNSFLELTIMPVPPHHYGPISPEGFSATSQHSLHALPGGTDRIWFPLNDQYFFTSFSFLQLHVQKVPALRSFTQLITMHSSNLVSPIIFFYEKALIYTNPVLSTACFCYFILPPQVLKPNP